MNTDKLFYDQRSPKGRAKAELLSDRHKVICVDSGLEPLCRVNWEFLDKVRRENEQTTIDCMRNSKRNSHLADVYGEIKKESAIQVFMRIVPEHVIARVVSGYKPENGFDLDIILVTDNEDRWNVNGEYAPHFWIELLPRFQRGQINTAYGSRLEFCVPIHVCPGQNKWQDINCFIFGEMIGNKIIMKNKSDRWSRHSGPWCLRNYRMVQIFVDLALRSHIEFMTPGGSPMVFGGTKMNVSDGTDEEAVLWFGNSK